MTANDPDEHGRDPATDPGGDADEAAGWIPAPRFPEPPPVYGTPEPATGAPPPGPSFDDSGWQQPVRLPDLPAPGYDPPVRRDREAGVNRPPGPSPDLDGWETSPLPAPPPWPWGPDNIPPGGGPPPGPALSIGDWRADEHRASIHQPPIQQPPIYQPQPQYGVPPPGPDVSLGGWGPGRHSGSGDAATGPWGGYREGWFRRLLARLRGRRARG